MDSSQIDGCIIMLRFVCDKRDQGLYSRRTISEENGTMDSQRSTTFENGF